MGAGKSTIGRMLAKLLALEFKDTDQQIEARTGADIPWIFDMEGEEGFRKREAALIDELLNENNLVLATGGGAVLWQENRQRIRAAGTVIYLTADIDQLVARTTRDKRRPLLQVDNPRQKIVELLDARDPLYRDVADLVIKTDKRSPKLVAEEIARRLEDEASTL